MNNQANKTQAAQTAHTAAAKAAGTAEATIVEPGSSAEKIGELAAAAAAAANASNANQMAGATDALQSEAARVAAEAAVHMSSSHANESISQALGKIQKKGRIRTFIGNNKILTSVIGIAVVGGIAYGVSLYLKKHVEIEVNL